MTLSSELNRLAESVEAATEPDRALDALIDKAAFPHEYDGDFFDPSRHDLPAYTSSLDAAMTLAAGANRAPWEIMATATYNLLVSGRGRDMAAEEYRQALARFFTAACLREAASKAPVDGGGE